MTSWLIDTDILSEILKGKDQTVAQNFKAAIAAGGEIFISSVTVYEILYGLHSRRAASQLGHFAQFLFDQIELTPTRSDYRLAAKIRAELRIAGSPIGSADPLIAATALSTSSVLVTGNVRHYAAVQSVGFDIVLIDWRSPPP
ncbi:MAG: PIN domain-containing protein [Armatimonadetes bacterium]|nr:PIN domain-containing protein [Armatimonadota bacterium]